MAENSCQEPLPVPLPCGRRMCAKHHSPSGCRRTIHTWLSQPAFSGLNVTPHLSLPPLGRKGELVGGREENRVSNSHRWWQSFQIPSFWSFLHTLGTVMPVFAGGYAITRLLCFHYVAELFVLDGTAMPQILANEIQNWLSSFFFWGGLGRGKFIPV